VLLMAPFASPTGMHIESGDTEKMARYFLVSEESFEFASKSRLKLLGKYADEYLKSQYLVTPLTVKRVSSRMVLGSLGFLGFFVGGLTGVVGGFVGLGDWIGVVVGLVGVCSGLVGVEGSGGVGGMERRGIMSIWWMQNGS
jgi:hypothetical protein